MKYRYVQLLWILSFLLGSNLAYAQVGTADCIGAIPVCQTTFTQTVGSTTNGGVSNEINPALSCLQTGEINSSWFIFTVQTAGQLCFDITPIDPMDDYDWAVFNLTNASCSDIRLNGALEVSCNFAINGGCGGATGPNGRTDPNFFGPCAAQNEECINAQVGETYLINVSNFTGSTSGYTIDFTASTAGVTDNRPPSFETARQGCNNAEIVVTFSENIPCDSLDASDFTVTGPGGPFGVTGVRSPNCDNGGSFDNVFILEVSPGLASNTTYNVTLNGSITDNCGNVAPNVTRTFTSIPLALSATASPDTICAGSATSITTNFSSFSGYSYLWTPSNLTDASVNVSPATSTTYQVEVNDPAGCTFTDQVVVIVKPTPDATFSLPANSCSGSNATITYTGSSGTNANYLWNFGNPSSVTGSGQGPYQVQWSTAGPKTITLQLEEDGCASNINSQTIDVIEIPNANFVAPTTACLNETAVVTYTGNAPATATFNWTVPQQTFPNGNIGPLNFAWNTPGTKTLCLQVEDRGCFSNLQCNDIEVQDAVNTSIVPVGDQCFMGNSFTFQPQGEIADTYRWDFGASASPPIATGMGPHNVSYQTPGTKLVTLFVTRNGCPGDTTTITFDVVEEPNADFVASTLSSCSNAQVTYTYQGTARPNQIFFWDFGATASPAVSTLEGPVTVNYATPGTKTVSLTTVFRNCTTQTTQTIVVNGSPQVDAGAAKEFCEGDGGVDLDASVIGGTMPYFYTWTCNRAPNCGIDSANVEDPRVNPTVTTPTEDVTYYFQVTDFNGCSSNLDSVVVTVKAKPKVDAGPDFEICPTPAPGVNLQGGLAADNNAPGPFLYSWTPVDPIIDPDDPNTFVRPDTTTIYTLTATSLSNGCSSDANTLDTLSTVTVTVLPNPTVVAGLDTGMCFGDTIQLQGFASGSGPNYQYTWTPTNTGYVSDESSAVPFVSPNITTVYTLSAISDAGCQGADSVKVQVDTEPTVNTSVDRDLCEGDTVQISAVANGDPNSPLYSFVWSPTNSLSDSNSTTPLAFPDRTTTYSVRAETQFGCLSQPEQVTLTVLQTPQVDLLQGDTIICEGESVELVASHIYNFNDTTTAYTWGPVGSFATTMDDSIVIAAPTSSTILTVTASSFSGRCSTTDQVLIEVNPAVMAVIEADTNLICSGDVVGLRALGSRGAASFEWLGPNINNPTAQSVTATPTQSTIYQVVISEGVCTDTADFAIQVTPTPVATYTSSEINGCDELTVSFNSTASNAFSYIWDFGDGSPLTNVPNPTHTYTAPGTYNVTFTATGDNGCSDVNNSVTVKVGTTPSVDFSSNPIEGSEIPLPDAGVNFTDLSASGVQWFWQFGDSTISTVQNPSKIYTEAGEYFVTLTLTDADGCIAQVTRGPYLIIEPSLVIPNVFTPNGDGTNDEFRIQYNGKSVLQYEIFDRWGRSIFTADDPATTWNGKQSNGSDSPEGVYYLIVKVGDRVIKGNVSVLR
ncbi:MAG: PKD domain-containing protein [Bacteroidia bacterium]|nr:PKD domain-containing protein [Bacteroidia bacterium]